MAGTGNRVGRSPLEAAVPSSLTLDTRFVRRNVPPRKKPQPKLSELRTHPIPWRYQMKRLVLAVAVLAVAAACSSETPETADSTPAMAPAPAATTPVDTALTTDSAVVTDSAAADTTK